MEKQKHHLKNIGPKSWKVLENAGIYDIETLRTMGAAAAYIAVKKSDDSVSLNLLYALAAGLKGLHWSKISSKEKARLNTEVEDLSEL